MPPIPPAALGAAVQGATQLTGAAVDAFVTGMQNRASRKWSERMYQRQYDDNIRFWEMQNEYNSPAAQMQRYMDAGLNKNLVFGAGNPGNAGSISTPDVQQPQFRVPDVGSFIGRAGGAIGSYLDYEIKAAQIDNLRVDNTIKQEDALLRRAQTRAMMTEAERKQFDLDFERGLVGVSADARRESLRKMKTETDVMLSRNEREAAMNASNLREAAERILNMRGQRLDTARAAELKQLDIELKRLGIQPSDPIYFRFLARFLGPDAIMKSGKSFGFFRN